jgi:hypothetical protein
VSFKVPHPEDFTYRQDAVDQAKTLKPEEFQAMVKNLVLELRGVRRSLRHEMERLKPEPYGRFTVLAGKESAFTSIGNSGIGFLVQTPYDIRVEVYRLGHEAVLEKLAELPAESK